MTMPANGPVQSNGNGPRPQRGLVLGLVSRRTAGLLRFDLLRLRARLLHGRRGLRPALDRLHLGCGTRRVAGWLNVDVAGSDFDVDLGAGVLPWADGSFSAVAAQHVIEHLEISRELLPLLRELRRVARPGAEIWLSCPDMEKVCRGYLEDGGASLLADRRTRFPEPSMDGMPRQQVINVLFHQGGEHRNLFDFELLRWALEQAGWGGCARVVEADFLARFPEFPPRNDDFVSLYVRAAAVA